MTTQLSNAQQGIITKEMEYVAAVEKIDEKLLMDRVAKGLVVIPANINHKNLRYMGIGYGLKTKINANIGNAISKTCGSLTRLRAPTTKAPCIAPCKAASLTPASAIK